MENRRTNQIPPRAKRFLHFRKQLRFAIFRRDGFCCRYCGRSIKDGAVLTLEHIIPLSQGGSWEADNLLTACQQCNQGKGSSLLSAAEAKMFSSGLLFAGFKGVMQV